MRTRNLPLLIFALIAGSVSAQWRSAPAVEAVTTADGCEATFRAGTSLLTVRVLADDLFRIRFRAVPSEVPDRSWAVVKTEWPAPVVAMQDSPAVFTFRTSKLTLAVHKNPLRLTFRDPSGEVINDDEPARGMSWSGTEVRVWKTMPLEERYYGFGEKAGALERRNTHMTMWNADIPAYNAGTDPLYQTIPFFYGLRDGRAYGIFFDNTYRSSFDMGKESRDRFSFGAENGDLNYYFFYGPAPATILTRFTELVGRMPLPPLWSLGYQQCRWSYASERRVREIADGFRKRKIPCDVIYLDIDYMDGYRIFTWNTVAFPDPTKMISDLRTQGFRIAVIVDPGIKVDSAYAAYRSGMAADCFLRTPDGRLFTGKVWPGVCAFPDFTGKSGRQWWGDQFAGLAAAGVRGWWNDMNEPSVFDVPTKTADLSVLHDDGGLRTGHAKSHNIYGMQMTRATYEGIRRHIPGERPFLLTRASYAGGWRYSASWTGDNVSSWDHLAMSLAMCLNLSISGQPFVGSDIGGFMGHPSGELFARWLQAGVFTPLMRAHSVTGEVNKEPWEYGAELTDVNRETVNLRYAFLPYIYTAMAEAASSGIPAMRPMVFDYPADRRYESKEDQFMFGPDILVAPVVSEGTRKKSVELPEGTWYDYWTGKKLDGKREYTTDAPLGRLPLFIRAGAVIPTRQVVQHSGEAPIDPLTLTAYPPGQGAPSGSTYYEDDGISFEFENGTYLRRRHLLGSDDSGITLKISAAEGAYTPPPRGLTIRVVDIPDKPSAVTANGKPAPGWTYDRGTATVTVAMRDSRGPIEIRVRR